MANGSLRGWKRIYAAVFNSVTGLSVAWKTEEAFRQEVLLLLTLGPLGAWLAQTGIEAILLIGTLILVLIVELLNTGIEIVVDRISFEHHELSGRAKDVGSAAVFLSLVLAGTVWLMVLVPKFI
jgi:diacylglycerol kinase (ATP)